MPRPKVPKGKTQSLVLSRKTNDERLYDGFFSRVIEGCREWGSQATLVRDWLTLTVSGLASFVKGNPFLIHNLFNKLHVVSYESL